MLACIRSSLDGTIIPVCIIGHVLRSLSVSLFKHIRFDARINCTRDTTDQVVQIMYYLNSVIAMVILTLLVNCASIVENLHFYRNVCTGTIQLSFQMFIQLSWFWGTLRVDSREFR